MSAPTFADIARAAEVSTATVSHALNGTGRIAEPTRRRVCEIATALGYARPGVPRTGSLGLAVTAYGGSAWDFTQVSYFSRFVTAATSAAHARGYALTTLPAVRGGQCSWHTLAVDGMLLLDSPPGDRMLDALRARGVPLVFDGRPASPRPGDVWVDNDHAATVRRVLEHFTESGARRIALHADFGREHYTREVGEAYERWCRERGRPVLLVPFDPQDQEGRAFDAAFGGDGRPDAVYCAYDPGGRQVLAAAARHRLRVPQDLLLACVSEDESYATCDPPVSTVTLHPDLLAVTAVSSLVQLVESGPEGRLGGGERTLPTALRVRASSHPAVMY
ncbi:LacI family DNA-binding transcriptional regulator [Streptomyces sp. NPDC006879]|uniref:LacI family DNA-binding transcriptional regulator n=1 Tax=Streptomyces sp. NPDC006879 TaxID=3364767 RepID=UPI0036BBE7A8